MRLHNQAIVLHKMLMFRLLALGEDTSNAFLLHLGTNTNKSTYMMNIYRDEKDKNQDDQIQNMKP